MSRKAKPARRSSILVTGGAGFIGSNLAHRLAGEGHEVKVLVTASASAM
jgi:CDP-paratose 2-epimerase